MKKYCWDCQKEGIKPNGELKTLYSNFGKSWVCPRHLSILKEKGWVRWR